MNKKNDSIILLFVLIMAVSASLAWALYTFLEEGQRSASLAVLGVVVLGYAVFEIQNMKRFPNSTGITEKQLLKSEATLIVLLAEDDSGIRSWDIKNRIGLVIGRGIDSTNVDIDLSDTEYYSLISSEHAVLNYVGNGWLLTDAGSKNGTALRLSASQRTLLLAPGEPVPINPGDTIILAEETRLAVR